MQLVAAMASTKNIKESYIYETLVDQWYSKVCYAKEIDCNI